MDARAEDGLEEMTMSTTELEPIDTTALRRIAEAATPGPWHAETDDWYRALARAVLSTVADDLRAEGAREALTSLADAAAHTPGGVAFDLRTRQFRDEYYPADLISTAPDDPARDAGPRIVSLIRRVDAAEAAVQRVREMHEPLSEYQHIIACSCGWWSHDDCPHVRALDGEVEA